MLLRSIFYTLLSLSCSAQAIVYTGNYILPKNLTATPPLYAYYKGTKIPLQKGAYSFTSATPITQLYCLFTQELAAPQAVLLDSPNTIRLFTIKKTSAYKCYKITKATSQWDIQEITLCKNNEPCTELPENTLLFLMDPHLINTLENKDWQDTQGAIVLPSITFKNTITNAQVANMSDRAALMTPDMALFNRTSSVATDRQGTTVRYITTD